MECYPWTLTKVPSSRAMLSSPSPSINLDAVNFELDFGVDDEEGKPLFDRTKKPNKTIPTVDRSAKVKSFFIIFLKLNFNQAAAIKTYEMTELLRKKEQEMKDVLEMEKKRLISEMNLQEELRRQKEAQFDEERQNYLSTLFFF